MSNSQPFSSLTAEEFLQTFIKEARKVAPFASCTSLQSFIQQIVFQSSACLEERYRKADNLEGPLDADQYAELIVLLKNSIGGEFEIVSASRDRVRIKAKRCPFGALVHSAPGLCHMTSSIFGGIAARNFGYAKVELQRRIALGSDVCDICIHLDPLQVEDVLGDEFFSDGHQVIAEVRAPDDLQRKIEQRLHALWTQDTTASKRELPEERPSLVAESDQMRELLYALTKIADTKATVLLTGETGVGKEVLAKALHGMSSRIEKPFVAVNCGSLPDELIESELFGHERGAFTDAKQRRRGRFELADGGTLFLDEVDSLSPKAQVSLLRVLQEGCFERVGGYETISCDVRVIAATNSDLHNLVEKGSFRKDLFFRLNVVPLHIPPLRERKEDIGPLVQVLLDRFRRRYSGGPREVGPQVMRALEEYEWPGNIRELENVLERAFLFAEGDSINSVSMGLRPDPTVPKDVGVDLKKLKRQAADEVEKRILLALLEKNKGNIKAVAESLRMTTRAVYQKLHYHGLSAKPRLSDDRIH